MELTPETCEGERMDIDHVATHPDAICPYCGHAVSDSWELPHITTVECGNEDCGQEFKVEREVVCYYTTRKIGGD